LSISAKILGSGQRFIACTHENVFAVIRVFTYDWEIHNSAPPRDGAVSCAAGETPGWRPNQEKKMKIAPLALAAGALLISASTAFAFTPPQDPDAPAQIVPLAPARAQETSVQQTPAPRAATAAKTRAQVEQELAEAKASGQYTFGELDYPPQRK